MLPARFVDAFDMAHAAASAATGLTDFGDADYHAGLRVLLESLDEDVHCTESGRGICFGAVVSALISRLHTQEGWRRHPEFRQVRIRKPLVITGIPRTGTTALHKLMAVDPQFQGLELWLVWRPMVRPPRVEWASHPSYQACAEGLRQMHVAMPGMAAAHDMSPDTVDECLEVLRQNFVSNVFGSSLGCRGYESWWWRQDERSSYLRYADVLRLIGLQDPRPWLLKNPGHLWGLDDLFAIFPDARVIQTHRDPASSIPSLCSLMSILQRAVEGKRFPPGKLGAIEAVKWRHALDRAESARRRHAAQIHDVRHADFHADPIGAIRAIYRRFDLELTPATEARMRQWLADQPAEQKSVRRYGAAEFGLTEGGLRELYAEYIERFDLVN